MGRRTKFVTITDAGRDAGKIFELTEMPADHAERWATRAILALANANAKLPEGVIDAGMAGLELSWRMVLASGLRALAGLSFREIEPLLDEMKHCIKWKPPGGAPSQAILPGENCQIEEAKTFFTLRVELLDLHLNFSLVGALSTSGTTPETPPAS